MKLENLRIVKEMRNSVNRKVNCETANLSKTVNAARKQYEDIVLIRDRVGLHSLPENLEEINRLVAEHMVFGRDCGSNWLSRPLKKGSGMLMDTPLHYNALKNAFTYFKDHPEWFSDYTFRVKHTQPLDVSIPVVREFMEHALDVEKHLILSY